MRSRGSSRARTGSRRPRSRSRRRGTPSGTRSGPWWKADLPQTDTDEAADWDTIAEWSGHDVRTLMAYYIIPSEEATKRTRGRLDRL
jgi:hypothetical protein